MKFKSEKDLKEVLPGIGRIVSKFWLQIRKRRLLLAGSFLALLVETGLRLLEPWSLKFVFDRVLIPRERFSYSRESLESIYKDTDYPYTMADELRILHDSYI